MITLETVLVTGATGFLGGYLVKELTPHYNVYALGRNHDKKETLENMGATFCCGDFTDAKQCERYFQGIDYVIHAGALSTVWGPWKDFYNTNVKGTHSVATLCRQYGVKRLIFVSSPSIYSERGDRLDIREEQYNPSNSMNNYIKSKIMAEEILKQFDDLYCVTVRPRGLIGSGDPSLVPRLLKANGSIGIPLFKNGKNIVDITCVENVAYALRLCLECNDIKGEAFNITNGEPREFKEVLELFLSSAGLAPKYLKMPLPLMYFAAFVAEVIYKGLQIQAEPPVTRYTVCTLGYSQTLNIDKAKQKLGYSPGVSLREGVKNYVR